MRNGAPRKVDNTDQAAIAAIENAQSCCAATLPVANI
jgi:hypothetical protein